MINRTNVKSIIQEWSFRRGHFCSNVVATRGLIEGLRRIMIRLLSRKLYGPIKVRMM